MQERKYNSQGGNRRHDVVMRSASLLKVVLASQPAARSGIKERHHNASNMAKERGGVVTAGGG